MQANFFFCFWGTNIFFKGIEETSELESDTWLSLLPVFLHHGIADLKVLFSFAFHPLSMLIIINQTPAGSPLWSWGLDPSLHPCPPSLPCVPCFYIVLIVILINIPCLHMTNCDALCILRPFCNNLTNLYSFSLTYSVSLRLDNSWWLLHNDPMTVWPLFHWSWDNVDRYWPIS